MVILFELTVPWDTNVPSSHKLTVNKYASLIQDLSRNFKVESYCFEVSVFGVLSKANRARMKLFISQCTGLKRQSAVKLINNVSKASLLGSFSIFSARNEASWNVGRDLSVNV